MAEASSAARAKPLHGGLPDDILVWEILVRLPPKSLLRCRAVSRAWRRATSARDFLLANHARQRSLPIVCASESILVLDHRAADAQLLLPVARLEDRFWTEASCDGLLVLCSHRRDGSSYYSVCNPATRQHAPLRQLPGFSVQAMYAHRPTGDYRLLLNWTLFYLLGGPLDQSCCFVLTLGSDQPPNYIGTAGARLNNPALLHDCLHSSPVHNTMHYQSDPQQHHSQTASKVVLIVFDTMSESFRQMRAPDVPLTSSIFEMDATLGIHSCDSAMGIVSIWVLQNYKDEDWEWKYNVRLPVAVIRERLRWLDDDDWDTSIVSMDGDVLLLVIQDGWMLYVDVHGELVDSFHRDGQQFCSCQLG